MTGSASFRGLDELETTKPEPDPEVVRLWLADRILETFARYVASGLFTVVQLRTIRALLIDRLTLRQLARQEGTSPQAIRARIEPNRLGQGGLARKAPEFYQWWRFMHRRRRRKGGC